MKKILLITLLLCLSIFNTVCAQSPGENWKVDFIIGPGPFSYKLAGMTSPDGLLVMERYTRLGLAASASRISLIKYSTSGEVWKHIIFDCYDNDGVRRCTSKIPESSAVSLSDGGGAMLTPQLVRVGGKSERWEKDFIPQQVAATNDGNTYITVNNSTVIKFDTKGQELWRLELPLQNFNPISTTNDGGFVMTGSGGTRKYGPDKQLQFSDPLVAHHIKQVQDGSYFIWGDYGVLKVNNSLNIAQPLAKYDEGGIGLEIKILIPTLDGGCVYMTGSKLVLLDSSLKKKWEIGKIGDGVFQTGDGEFVVYKNTERE